MWNTGREVQFYVENLITNWILIISLWQKGKLHVTPHCRLVATLQSLLNLSNIADFRTSESPSIVNHPTITTSRYWWGFSLEYFTYLKATQRKSDETIFLWYQRGNTKLLVRELYQETGHDGGKKFSLKNVHGNVYIYIYCFANRIVKEIEPGTFN